MEFHYSIERLAKRVGDNKIPLFYDDCLCNPTDASIYIKKDPNPDLQKNIYYGVLLVNNTSPDKLIVCLTVDDKRVLRELSLVKLYRGCMQKRISKLRAQQQESRIIVEKIKQALDSSMSNNTSKMNSFVTKSADDSFRKQIDGGYDIVFGKNGREEKLNKNSEVLPDELFIKIQYKATLLFIRILDQERAKNWSIGLRYLLKCCDLNYKASNPSIPFEVFTSVKKKHPKCNQLSRRMNYQENFITDFTNAILIQIAVRDRDLREAVWADVDFTIVQPGIFHYQISDNLLFSNDINTNEAIEKELQYFLKHCKDNHLIMQIFRHFIMNLKVQCFEDEVNDIVRLKELERKIEKAEEVKQVDKKRKKPENWIEHISVENPIERGFWRQRNQYLTNSKKINLTKRIQILQQISRTSSDEGNPDMSEFDTYCQARSGVNSTGEMVENGYGELPSFYRVNRKFMEIIEVMHLQKHWLSGKITECAERPKKGRKKRRKSKKQKEEWKFEWQQVSEYCNIVSSMIMHKECADIPKEYKKVPFQEKKVKKCLIF